MMHWWYQVLEQLLPFSWVSYMFMKNALLAILLITPAFALLGTMVINNRLTFLTEVMGHSALTGIALGVILGIQNPTAPMIGLAIVLAIAINLIKDFTKTPTDTVLGVFLAFMLSLGIVILSRNGGFAKYTNYLIGDILSISSTQIIALLVILLLVFMYWYFLGNKLFLTSVHSSLARTRGINTLLIETSFSILLAIVIMLSIRLVGVLIINSLLILPAAASRLISKNIHTYTRWAVLISMVSGVTGLITSYYWETASGATIVLFTVLFYVVAIIVSSLKGKRAD